MNFIKHIRAEFSELDFSVSSLRKFGLTVGGILLAIALWIFWRKDGFATVSSTTGTLLGLGGALVVFGLVAPAMLRGVYMMWMLLAILLGFVMSRVLLTVLFITTVTPIGVIGRLLGKKFLPVGIDKTAQTYWKKRDTTKKADYEKMF